MGWKSPLAWCLTLALSTSTSALDLSGDEVWVIALSAESRAFTLAVRDVLKDAYSVLGRTPLVLPTPPPAGALPSNTTLVFFGTPSAAPWLVTSFETSKCFAGWESHCVLAFPASPSVPYASLVATGEGMRGAIFAAYTLSEEVLGVNPLRHYTDDAPTFAAPLAVDAALAIYYAPPRFKYRGLFINDEDLLAGLFPGDTLGTASIDSRAYLQAFETMLRLKANVVVPATNPFPDGELYALAAARGLILSHHHYDLVGGNVFSWPIPSSDWTYTKDPGTMSAMWRAAIGAQAAFPEVMYSIGLRGLNDYPYPCSTPADCGRQISEAMSNQTSWIRDVQPNATIVAFLWQEALDYLTRGLLVIPEGVKIIFTDAGSGFIRVDSNWSTYCDGVYYHTAMYNGQANQLSEMVPVDRIISQYAPVLSGSRTLTYTVDNLSDIRPVPMTTSFWLRFAWDPTPFLIGDPKARALEYYAYWGARQHAIAGGATAPAAQAFAALWADFFEVPYIQGGSSDNGLSNWIQDAAKAAEGIHKSGTVDRKILSAARLAVLRLSNNTDATGAVVRDELAALLTRARALAAELPPSRVGYFTSHTLMQVAMHSAAVDCLVLLTDALGAGAAGNWSTATSAAWAALAAADAVVAAMRDAESASAPTVWRGLYAGDVLTNMARVRDTVRVFAHAVTAHAQPSVPLPMIDNTNLWYGWEYWQSLPAVVAAYPLSLRFDPDVAFTVMVRINCVFADVDAGSCTPNPDGGIFRSGAGGRVTLQVLTSDTAEALGPALDIRYTLDGSLPSKVSAVYVPGEPIALDAVGTPTVHITAALFDAGSGERLGGYRNTTWVRF